MTAYSRPLRVSAYRWTLILHWISTEHIINVSSVGQMSSYYHNKKALLKLNGDFSRQKQYSFELSLESHFNAFMSFSLKKVLHEVVNEVYSFHKYCGPWSISENCKGNLVQNLLRAFQTLFIINGTTVGDVNPLYLLQLQVLMSDWIRIYFI